MKHYICLILILLLLFSLNGCTQRNEEITTLIADTSVTKPTNVTNPTNVTESKETFWIVTEEDRVMNATVEAITEQFQEEHPELQINLQILPNNDKDSSDTSYKAAREIMLDQLRTQILAGRGPDVFLLPAGGATYEMLFEDVNLAMRNGLFEDISTYYDADAGLDKDALVTGVMDGGVLDGQRYILPLRFDIPIAYVDVAQFEALGGKLSMLEGGIFDLTNQLLATGNPDLISGAYISDHAMNSFGMNFWGEVVDYDKRELLLSAEELAEFAKTLQTVRSANCVAPEEWIQRYYGYSIPAILTTYLPELKYWTDYSCMYIGRMCDMLDNSAYAKLTGTKIAAIPVASAEGTIIADVTYFGAVGYGCKDTAVAYDYLRLYLTEESQITNNTDSCANVRYCGWPVRTGDALVQLWDNRKLEIDRYNRDPKPEWDNETKLLQKEIVKQIFEEMVIESQDLLLTDFDIDSVQIPISLERELNRNFFDVLNDGNTGIPMEADIEALAEEWLDELYWHLAEG